MQIEILMQMQVIRDADELIRITVSGCLFTRGALYAYCLPDHFCANGILHREGELMEYLENRGFSADSTMLGDLFLFACKNDHLEMRCPWSCAGYIGFNTGTEPLTRVTVDYSAARGRIQIDVNGAMVLRVSLAHRDIIRFMAPANAAVRIWEDGYGEVNLYSIELGAQLIR